MRHAIYEQARTALHEQLGNDPQISDDELVNEHYALEVAIYKVEEDLLLSDMRRFVRAETALFPSSLSFISKVKEFCMLGRKQVCPARLVLTWINVPIASRVEIMSRASVTEDAAFPST